MNATDVNELDGKLVLICSAADHRNPPTGRRGTLHVTHDPRTGDPIVQVEMEFPQMFTSPAHHRTVTLNEREIAELLASDHYGTYSVTLEGRLDPEARPGNE